MTAPGYGIGDLIAVSQLARSVYQSCKAAPKDFSDIAMEVNGLRIVLEETDSLAADLDVSDAFGQDKKEKLRELSEGCRGVLTDLDALVGKFGSLGGKGRGLGARGSRAFDRFRWTQGDVVAMRGRLVSNVNLLTDFKTSIQAWVFISSKKGSSLTAHGI